MQTKPFPALPPHQLEAVVMPMGGAALEVLTPEMAEDAARNALTALGDGFEEDVWGVCRAVIQRREQEVTRGDSARCAALMTAVYLSAVFKTTGRHVSELEFRAHLIRAGVPVALAMRTPRPGPLPAGEQLCRALHEGRFDLFDRGIEVPTGRLGWEHLCPDERSKVEEVAKRFLELLGGAA